VRAAGSAAEEKKGGKGGREGGREKETLVFSPEACFFPFIILYFTPIGSRRCRGGGEEERGEEGRRKEKETDFFSNSTAWWSCVFMCYFLARRGKGGGEGESGGRGEVLLPADLECVLEGRRKKKRKKKEKEKHLAGSVSSLLSIFGQAGVKRRIEGGGGRGKRMQTGFTTASPMPAGKTRGKEGERGGGEGNLFCSLIRFYSNPSPEGEGRG